MLGNPAVRNLLQEMKGCSSLNTQVERVEDLTDFLNCGEGATAEDCFISSSNSPSARELDAMAAEPGGHAEIGEAGDGRGDFARGQRSGELHRRLAGRFAPARAFDEMQHAPIEKRSGLRGRRLVTHPDFAGKDQIVRAGGALQASTSTIEKSASTMGIHAGVEPAASPIDAGAWQRPRAPLKPFAHDSWSSAGRRAARPGPA